MEVKPSVETFAKIKVIGVGGSGGSAVNRMLESGLKGLDFVAINTDAQALHHSSAPHKVHIGQNVTRGLGAGMDPEQGRQAAEDDSENISAAIKGADMVFVTGGLGGGTCSGAAPVVAALARKAGALTVGVVTLPFSFEGARRAEIAQQALAELAEEVDTIITIPNDRLLKLVDKKMSLLDAFKIVDDVLRQGVQGISEIITVPELINVDFADVRAVLQDAGTALMGIGMAEGEDRAVVAARQAIESPLLDVSIEGAKGILFAITGPESLSMNEVNEAARVITGSAHNDAKIIFGATIDETLGEGVKITVIAAGFGDGRGGARPVMRDPQQEETMRPEFFTSRSDKSIFEEPEVKDIEDKKNDELEIPAFIRRKMKK